METKITLTNRIFVKYVIIFGSSLMCIHVQKPLRSIICSLIWGCTRVEAIQAHYKMFSRTSQTWDQLHQFSPVYWSEKLD